MAIKETFSSNSDVQDEIVRDVSIGEDHRQACDDILGRLRKRGYSDTKLEKLIVTEDLRKTSALLSAYYTCKRNFKHDGDFWHLKMKDYAKEYQTRYSSLEIAFDEDDDGVIDEGEREILQTRIIR